MTVERRGRQEATRTEGSRPGHSTGNVGSEGAALNSWVRIRLAARRNEVLTNLFCHFNVENFREAFRAIDGSKAKGIDGISKDDYGQELDANLADLVTRLHRGTYRPKPKKEVLIPKANGKTRPIAISCFEDKLVEWGLGKVLESVYEEIFSRHSYGFRPRKSAHDAIETTYSALARGERPFVVEIDLASFFNTVPHRRLMRLIGKRIADPRLLGLIARFLHADVMRDGFPEPQEVGTPQGSIMSPILANIYLHYAIDEWFEKHHKSKDAVMVRYADDAVFLFREEGMATAFLEALRTRLAEFGLSLNEEKTRIVALRKGDSEIFHFLGFSFYWARKKARKQHVLSVKTHKESLHRKMRDFDQWIKTNRSRLKLESIWRITAAKLRGHYAYYGYVCNRRKLSHYHFEVIGSLFRWLNRRSQKSSYTWEGFKQRLAVLPLPTPPTQSALKTLGWNPYA